MFLIVIPIAIETRRWSRLIDGAISDVTWSKDRLSASTYSGFYLSSGVCRIVSLLLVHVAAWRPGKWHHFCARLPCCRGWLPFQDSARIFAINKEKHTTFILSLALKLYQPYTRPVTCSHFWGNWQLCDPGRFFLKSPFIKVRNLLQICEWIGGKEVLCGRLFQVLSCFRNEVIGKASRVGRFFC